MNKKIIFLTSVFLFTNLPVVAWLQSCKESNMDIREIALPRGEHYTNVANRVQFMYAVQEEIVRLSHSDKYDEQYRQCKYDQIETAFTNLAHAVRLMESLLRETHNELINCDGKHLSGE